jgi:ribosomal protein S18 acetylase RimI-like enzyme
MIDYNDFANQIRAQYPEYKNMGNYELAKLMIKKYPVYKDQVSFGSNEKPAPVKRDWSGVTEEPIAEKPKYRKDDYIDVIQNKGYTSTADTRLADEEALQMQKDYQAQEKIRQEEQIALDKKREEERLRFYAPDVEPTTEPVPVKRDWSNVTEEKITAEPKYKTDDYIDVLQNKDYTGSSKGNYAEAVQMMEDDFGAKEWEAYNKVNEINLDIISDYEENSVPELNKRFRGSGIYFEETGLGDQIKVISSMDDKFSSVNEETFQLFPKTYTGQSTIGVFDEKAAKEEQRRLQEFIRNSLLKKSEKEYLNSKDLTYEKMVKLKVDDPKKYGETFLNEEELSAWLDKQSLEIASSSIWIKNRTEDINKTLKEYEGQDIPIEVKRKLEYDIDRLSIEKERIIKKDEETNIIKEGVKTAAGYYYSINEAKGNLGGVIGRSLVKGAMNLTKLEADLTVDLLVSYLGDDATSSLQRSKMVDAGMNDTEINNSLRRDLKDKVTKKAVESLQDILSFGTTKEYVQSEKRNDIEKVASFLSESIGTAASAGGNAVLSKLSFFAQSYNSMEDQMNSSEFDKLNIFEKKLLSVPYGIAIGYLERLGFRATTGGSKVLNGLVTSSISRALTQVPKDASLAAMRSAINKSIVATMADTGLSIVGGSLIEGAVEGTQNITEIAAKQLFNRIEKQDYFKDVPDLTTKDGMAKALEMASEDFYYGMLGGLVMGSAHEAYSAVKDGYSNKKLDANFAVLYNSVTDPNLRRIVKSEIKANLASGAITKEVAQAQMDAIGKSYSIFKSMPDNLSMRDKREGFNLIREKQLIEKEIEGKDPSLVDAQKKRISEINEQLKLISNNATKETTNQQQAVTTEGGVSEYQGTSEGQQKVGQGEGGQRQATVNETDSGNSTIPSQVQKEVTTEATIEERRLEELKSKGVDKFFSEVPGETVAQVKERERKQKVQDQINAKYDAELAALGTDTKADKTTDENYDISQEVNDNIAKANPDASVLLTPKGNDLSLTAVYVGKEKRGKGIGTKVLETVKSEANRTGKKIVLDATNELDSETDLERLSIFYEKNGFKKVGENKFEYNPQEVTTEVVIDKPAIATNTTAEVGRVKSLNEVDEDGATFNIDGVKYEGPGLVVPVISMNTTMEELTPEMISNFVEEHSDKIGDSDTVKVGIYKFPNSNQVSIDLNILAPESSRGQAIEFGRLSGQESLFDMSTFENVKTGATGENPMEFTPKQFKEIAKALKEGRMPNVFGTQEVAAKTETDSNKNLVTLENARQVASKQNTPLKQRIAKTAAMIMRALPGVKIYLHEDTDQYTDALSNKTGENKQSIEDESSAGSYIDGEIHLDMSKADLVTLMHEAFHHALMVNGIKGKYIIDMANGLRGIIKDKQRLADLEKFIAQYNEATDQETLETRSDEFIAQLGGILSSNQEELTTTGLVKFKVLINKLFKKLRIGDVFTKASTSQDAVNFINAITKGLNIGEEINNIGVNGVFDTSSTKRKKSILATGLFERYPDNPNIKLEENVPLSRFNGKTSNIFESDRMTGAYIADDKGNKIFNFFGGIFFPRITGKWWASSSLSTATSIANNSKRDADGFIYGTPIIMSPGSQMSNNDMLLATLEFMKMDVMKKNSTVSKPGLMTYIEKAFEKKKITGKKNILKNALKTSNNIEQIFDELEYVLFQDEPYIKDRSGEYILTDNRDRISKLTFEERKEIVSGILGDPKVMGSKFPSAGSISQMSDKFTEPETLKSNKLWDIVVVYRTKGNLVAKPASKNDEFYHKSYPHEILAVDENGKPAEIEVFMLDGAYNLTEAIPAMTKSSGDVFTWEEHEQAVKSGKYKSEAVALNQYGRTSKLSRGSGEITARKKQLTTDKEAKPGYDAALEAIGETKEQRESWRRNNKVNQKQKRNPIVEQAAKDYYNELINQEEYLNIVSKNQPIKSFKEVPTLPSLEDITNSLDTSQVATGIIGLTKNLEDGEKVASRLDIPAYEDYDTWVVSIHDGNKEGKSIAYGQTAVLKNVDFKTFPGSAIRIAMDTQNKSTIARMFGDWVNEDPEAVHARAKELMNDPAWTQVGMNPFRHSWFYDKTDGMPISSAEEVIQVGALVLAKNAKKISPSDPMFETKSSKGGKIKFQKSSQETRMDNESESVFKKSLDRGTDWATATQNALDYIQKSKWYQEATDIEREQKIRDFKQSKNQKLKKAPSVAKIMGTPKPKMVTVNEAVAFKDQLRKEAKAAREAKADLNSKRKSLSDAIKGMVKLGKLKVSQASTIIKRVSQVNLDNPVMVDRLIDYAAKVFERADYQERLDNAFSYRRAIKRLLKSDNQAQVVGMANEFAKIDPSMVENIDDYIAMAEIVKNAVAPSKVKGLDVVLKEAANIEAVSNFSKDALEKQEQKLKDELLAVNNDLLESGAISGDMTIKEIQEILNAIKDPTYKMDSKEKERYVRSYLSKRFESLASIVTDIIKTNQNPFTGEQVAITVKDRAIISDLLKVDLSEMSIRDAIFAVEAMDNFINNGITSKLEGALSAYKGQLGLKEQIKSGKVAKALKLYFSKKIGRYFATEFTPLPLMIERMFSGVTSGISVMKSMGLDVVVNGVNKANNLHNKIINEYYEKFIKNSKTFHNPENVYERGMLSFLKRNVTGSLEEMKAETSRRVDMIKESIDTLMNDGDESQRAMAEIYQKVFDKLGVSTGDIDVIDARASKENRDAVDWWINQWSKHYQDLHDVSLSVYNYDLGSDVNYTPDRYKTIKTESFDEKLTERNSSFLISMDHMTDKGQTGVLMKANRPKVMPEGRYISLDFDTNNSSSLKGALVDINTAAGIRQVDGFLNSKSLSKLIPTSEDRDVLIQRTNRYIRRAKGKIFIPSDLYKDVDAALNFAASLGVGKALGGVLQSVKQTIPIAISTAINTGKFNMSDFDFNEWLNKTGMPISNRGIESLSTIESIDRRMAAKGTKFKDSLKWVQEKQQLYVKWFLSNPDVFIARSGFQSYYLQYMGNRSIDWATHTPNQDALNYAQAMVDRQQNISDPMLGGEFLTSEEGMKRMAKKILFPFSSFGLNQKARLNSDLINIGSKTTSAEDRKIAVKSAFATIAEMVAYRAISVGIGYGFYKAAEAIITGAIGDDDDDDEENNKKWFLSATKFPVKSMINDLISPIQMTDKYVTMGTDYLLSLTTGDTKSELDDLVKQENEMRLLKDQEKMDAKQEEKFREEQKTKSLYQVGSKFDDNAGLGMVSIASDLYNKIYDDYVLATTGEFQDDYKGNITIKKIRPIEQELMKNTLYFSGLFAVGLLPKESDQVVTKVVNMVKKNAMSESEYGKYEAFKKDYNREPNNFEMGMIRSGKEYDYISKDIEWVKREGGLSLSQSKEYIKLLNIMGEVRSVTLEEIKAGKTADQIVKSMRAKL